MLQNTSRYVIRLPDRLMCIYYDKFDGICFKQYINNHWINPYTIYKEGSRNFSVTISNNQQLYLFCQDQKGSIILCNYSGGEWKSKVLKDNKSSTIYNVNFHAIIKGSNMNLSYNLPDEPEKKHYLINTISASAGTWSMPDKIDEIIPFNTYPYIVQKISEDHYIFYYQIRKRENILGYRELSAFQNKFSNFKIILSTPYQIADVAFLTTRDTIHALYVMISMFTSRLVYVKKYGPEVSMPVTIFENQRIENIMIFILENQIWVTFYSNNVLYYATSVNKGESFSRPQRFRGQMYGDVNKAIYLTDSKQYEDKIYLSALYTMENMADDILLVPDLYPKFYTELTSIKQKEVVEAEVEIKAAQYNDYSEEVDGQLTILSNKLSQALVASKEKDKQLIEMTKLLQERNEHISLIEAQWRRKVKELTEENEKLKIKLEKIERDSILKVELEAFKENDTLNISLEESIENSDDNNLQSE